MTGSGSAKNPMCREIVGLIPKAEQWGRELGCIGALIESREGWARVMRPHGYRLFQTTIRKEF